MTHQSLGATLNELRCREVSQLDWGTQGIVSVNDLLRTPLILPDSLQRINLFLDFLDMRNLMPVAFELIKMLCWESKKQLARIFRELGKRPS